RPASVPSWIRLSTRPCMSIDILRSRSSAVDLRRDEVEARDHRDEVGDHEVPAELLDHADGRERPRADLAAIRERRAVAHDVPAHVAARALDAHVGIARGRLVVARHLGDHRPGRYLLQALADDAAALLHLDHAHDVAVEAVAERAHLAPADG